MQKKIDRKYKSESLVEWEIKSLKEKFSFFSFSKKSTWKIFGQITLGLCIFGFLIPFLPPRYGWSNWTPPKTSEEYLYRLTNLWIAIPIFIFSIFAFVEIRNRIDIFLGAKYKANFKISFIINLLSIKILLMNGWRPFSIKSRQSYFSTVTKGQIITIKRTGTFRLIDYYIRDEQKFNEEQT
jgi:hypothetical protein